MLLAGLRVVACEIGLAGPLCTRLLADLGADVVKVEPPEGGDVTRGWDTIANGLSSGFVWVNRGKRSVALDVRDPETRPTVERLVASADVFLQNFAPGWAARVGLDEPAVRALREDVVYVEISGYGPDGPARAQRLRPRHAGRDRAHLRDRDARGAGPRWDLGLRRRGRVVRGGRHARRADPPREDRGGRARPRLALRCRWPTGSATSRTSGGTAASCPERTGARHPLFCPYGPFSCADGLVSLAVLSPEHWRVFCLDVLGRPDLHADERYATNEERVAARADLEPEIERELAARTAEEWIAALEAAGIPCGRVHDVAGVLAHPAAEHGKLVAEVGSPAGPLPTIGVPFLVGGARPQPGDVPALGEHTDEVLRELGL